jgi:hypothetical protein
MMLFLAGWLVGAVVTVVLIVAVAIGCAIAMGR